MRTYFLFSVLICTFFGVTAQNATQSTITFNPLRGLSTFDETVLDSVYHHMSDHNYHSFQLASKEEMDFYTNRKLLSIVKARATTVQNYYITKQAVKPENVFIKYGGSYPRLWLRKPQSLMTASGEIKLAEKDRQCFSFNPGIDKMITSSKGTKFYFPPYAFETMDGKTIGNESINICLYEFMDKKTLVFSGLTTDANGKMLETGGSFYIEARLDGQELRLKPGANYTVELPATSSFPDMFTYYGHQKNGLIDWTVNKNEPALFNGNMFSEASATQPAWENEVESDGEEVVVQEYFNNEDLNFADNRQKAVLDQAYIESVQAVDFYELSAGKLGWINCDRFYEVKNTSTLAIKVDSDSAMVVRLVFQDINSVMPCYANSNHVDQYEVSGIPTGEKVLVLAYAVKDENAILGYKEIVIGENATEHLSLNNLSKSRFEGVVAELLN